MSNWQNLAARDIAAQLRTFGEPITYLPYGGVGLPIETTCIQTAPAIEQSMSPGYFADIHVDPLVIAAPQKKDEVAWADGAFYVVTKVARPLPDSMYILALHRKFDPA